MSDDPSVEFQRQFDIMRRRQKGDVKVGTGFPETSLLQAWAHQLRDAFGEMPYHTGSSLRGKEWRDVDVRVLLDDDKWRRLIGTDPTDRLYQQNFTWNALCISISLWGQRVTGLPIDFQFQPQHQANEMYNDYRSAIGIHWDKSDWSER